MNTSLPRNSCLLAACISLASSLPAAVADGLVNPAALDAVQRPGHVLETAKREASPSNEEQLAFADSLTPQTTGSRVRTAQRLELAPASGTKAESIPTPSSKPGSPLSATEGRLRRPLTEIGIGTAPDAELLEQMEKIPEDYRIKNLAASQLGDWLAGAEPLASNGARFHPGTAFAWAAPASFHRPLYFEQPNLERYGHELKLTRGGRGCLQSAVSAAHFFATIPALPYLIGAHGGCCEQQYVLGAYRPGSCNYHQLVTPPVSARGLLYEGAAAAGLVFFIP